MKRIFSVVLVLAMVLALTACGKSDGTAAAVSGTEESSSAATSAEAEESSSAATSAGTEESSSAATSAEAEESSSAAKPPVEEPAAAYALSVDTQTADTSADDGTVVYVQTWDVPTVTISDNEAAQKAIQADLDALMEAYHANSDSYGEIAKEDYAYRQQESAEDAQQFGAYSDTLTITAKRMDGQVISLLFEQAGYSGGAHGWDNLYARNYDAKTGEVLTFDKLGTDFRAQAEQLVADAAAKYPTLDDTTDGDQVVIFSDYQDSIPLVVLDGTEDGNALYGLDEDSDTTIRVDQTFYFDENGITFLANESVIAPYAAGRIEFDFQYDQLADILSSDYMPA